MKNYHEINSCRISNSKNLITVLNLGYQSLTGVFPRTVDEKVTEAALVDNTCDSIKNLDPGISSP